MTNWNGDKFDVVYEAGLTVTTHASLDSDEVSHLPKGTAVQVFEEDPTPTSGDGSVRARIKAGSISGWITIRNAKRDYLLPQDDEEEDDNSGWGNNSWGSNSWGSGDWHKKEDRKPKGPELPHSDVLQNKIDQLNATAFKGNEIDAQASTALQALGEQAALLYLNDLEEKGEKITHASNYLKAALRKIGLDPKNPDPATLTGTHPKLVAIMNMIGNVTGDKTAMMQWQGGGGGGGKKREGDWECTKCGSNVFAHKLECFKCGTMRDFSAASEPQTQMQRPQDDGTCDPQWDLVSMMIEKFPSRAAYGEDEVRMGIEQKIISMMFISARVEAGVLGQVARTFQAAGGVVKIARPEHQCYADINKWSTVAFMRMPLQDPDKIQEKEQRRGKPY